MRYFILLCCAAITFASCGKPQPPQYLGYSNVRLEKAGLKNSIVAADLRFYNPNNYALKLKQADMDVYLNNRLMGHSVIDSLLTLPGRDTAAVPLRLQVAGKDLLASATQLLLNPTVRLRMKGNAKVGRGSFFINLPVDYEGTQKIDLTQLDSLLEPAQQP